jgi:thiamine biosynthesis lipoprotein
VSAEVADSFACFGARCAVHASGPGAPAAVAAARRQLLAWHDAFTRFSPASELSRLNDSPDHEVPVSHEMGLLVESAIIAAEWTGGLVDATLLGELEHVGYRADLRAPLRLDLALRLAPPRRPAGPSPASRWQDLQIEATGRLVTRPPGVRLDSGGLAKGLFADLLADRLAGQDDFAIDCAGDLRVGGRERPVQVAGPFDGRVLHTFHLADAGVATTGIGRRSWLDARGAPAHHLLDPATGRPAFTGVVQATALAPTALEAEMRAKAAVLSGPDEARAWLAHGGLVVLDDGSHELLEPSLSQIPASRTILSP